MTRYEPDGRIEKGHLQNLFETLTLNPRLGKGKAQHRRKSEELPDHKKTSDDWEFAS